VPEVSRFLGVVVTMYFNDHNPPHFHVRYKGYRARFRIDPPDRLDGWVPSRIEKLVIEWGSLHTDELLRNWTSLATTGTFSRIEPLE
jgi:hypothetical protein